jgi:hypothetical protein
MMKALGKSLAGQATMMFVGRDHENLLRARHMRRLSFVIWSGALDQYISTLPTFQEKLVEALKISNATVLRILVQFAFFFSHVASQSRMPFIYLVIIFL